MFLILRSSWNPRHGVAEPSTHISLKNLFIFNWSIIALQCCVGFCYTVLIGYMYTYNPLPLEPPALSQPSRLSQRTKLSSLCYTTGSHQSSILHIIVYICQYYSLNLPHPPLPAHVHKSLLYICISIAVLKIGSSVLFFQISYVCVNIIFVLKQISYINPRI